MDDPWDQLTKKEHHHAGAVCWVSGMGIVNQLTPPPGAYAEGADGGQRCRVLYKGR